MERFQYFNHWTDEQRRDCFGRAKVRIYKPEEAIFEEGRSPINYVHFVLSGRCMILQCLKLIKIVTKHGNSRYQLADAQPVENELEKFIHRQHIRMAQHRRSTEQPADQSCLPPAKQSSQNPTQYEYRFIDIGSYACGSVFGVGEHMDDRSVVARDHVQCLLIPRYWLLQKRQNANNVWNRVRIFLEQRQPSREQLFEWYHKELRWRRYRGQLRNDVVSGRVQTNPTALCDVPSICRIEESDAYV